MEVIVIMMEVTLMVLIKIPQILMQMRNHKMQVTLVMKYLKTNQMVVVSQKTKDHHQLGLLV